MDKLRDFICDDHGATAIEYAILAAGISIAIITAAQAVGNNLDELFETINAAL